MQDLGAERVHGAAASPAPRLERRTWTRAAEARRGGRACPLAGMQTAEARKALAGWDAGDLTATWGRSLCPFSAARSFVFSQCIETATTETTQTCKMPRGDRGGQVWG